jgi:glycerol-3-phosphate O-acyltransferase
MSVSSKYNEERRRIFAKQHINLLHNIAACEPADVHVFTLIPLIVDQQQGLLSSLVVASSSERDPVVEVEIVIIVHVCLDGIEIDVNVFELPHKVEA